MSEGTPSRQAVELLRTYTGHLAGLDVDACAAMLAEDAVLTAPFAPEPIPARTEGAAAIAAVLGAVLGMFRRFEWVDAEYHATDDPGLAFMTARSEIELVNGEEYRQQYVILARTRDGQIVEHCEYFDPARAQSVIATMSGS